jgi:hypothetical protein
MAKPKRNKGHLNSNEQYTSQPSDVIMKVTLIEIHVNLHDKYNSCIIFRGSDTFVTLKERDYHLAKEKGISIRLARLHVLMADGREHKLTIEPPYTMEYDGDHHIIRPWLIERGFLRNK